MRYGHLETVEIELRTLAPVFIGSGEKLTKKEYIFDRQEYKIHMPDLPRLVEFLRQRSLIAEFENYLLNERDLAAFLARHGITEKNYTAFVSYTIDAGEAAKSDHFRDVLTFIKGPDGHPYIPGPSLKGALRTAIAASLLKKAGLERSIGEAEHEANNFRSAKGYLSKTSRDLESSLFCKLKVEDPRRPNGVRWHDIVNDFMRGISISDSEPLDYTTLTLCGKYDRKPKDEPKQLPIFRECLEPGTRVRLIMTLNRPLLAKVGIDKKYIEEALHSFAEAHYENFEMFFAEHKDDADTKTEQGVDIILGGGAGYVSKTLTYSLIRDREQALRLVSKMLSKQFRIHKHEKDLSFYRVSPHTLKTTFYKGSYYQMGRCELVFS